MKQYTLIHIGKVKEQFCQIGITEFSKRIKSFQIITLKDSNKEKEGADILTQLTNTQYDIIITLDEHGEEYTSVNFSKFLQEKQAEKMCFVIGGADGLSPEVLKVATKKIALSKMTFTHEMAQLFFIEQLYRAQSILEGKKYHRV